MSGHTHTLREGHKALYYIDFKNVFAVSGRNPNGDDVRRATALMLIGRLQHSGIPIGCQNPRDSNGPKYCWGSFGSRKQFVDMHNC